MEQIRVSHRLVVTVLIYFLCLGFNVVICSEPLDALIKTYVSSSLPSNDDLVDHSAMLKDVPDISESEWDSLVIQSKLPVMVTFINWEYGRDSKNIRDVLTILDSRFIDSFKFYIVHTIKDPNIAQSYNVDVKDFTTTMVFKGGIEMVGRVDGINLFVLEALVLKYK